MDLFANHHAMIVCDEKIVTQKYIKRGCPIFLAQVTKKETEDKSKEKRLEDVSTVQDFSEIFLEDFSGLPPTRQVEIQIDLVPGAVPKLCSASLLALPEGSKNFVVYCDASRKGLGVVLMQREKNLIVKDNDLAAYTQRFQELTMMYTKMVPEEEDRVKKFIGGFLDNIQGNVIVAEPTKLQDVVRIANNLMDQKLKGYAVKNDKNKRRLKVNQRDNRG
nr:hypothetical protein [Tanacetum cinerariifolium]